MLSYLFGYLKQDSSDYFIMPFECEASNISSAFVCIVWSVTTNNILSHIQRFDGCLDILTSLENNIKLKIYTNKIAHKSYLNKSH